MSTLGAFDFLCGLLSLDDSPELSDRLRHTAHSGAIPLHEVVALASKHWVSAAVLQALHRKAVHGALSKDAADYFEGMATLNRQRNAKILSEAIVLTRILNGIDVVPIFLKGGANLLSGLYPDPGMRIMLDLDLLVPETHLSRCAVALQANDYARLIDNGFPAHHHYPPLGRPGSEVSIELHVDPLDIPYRRFLSPAEISEHAVELKIDGARLAVPPAYCRLIHCIAHTQFSDHAYAFGRLPLRELLDTALFSRSEGIDWQAISARFASRGDRMALAFHLLATKRLLGGAVPDHDRSNKVVEPLFRRARYQVAHPRIGRWIETLLRPWLLFRRALSHPLLRRRLLRCLLDPTWYVRQWRMLRGGGN